MRRAIGAEEEWVDEAGMAPGSPASVEHELLEQARRQTKALEGIHGVAMFLLAVMILGVVIAVAVAVNGS